VLRSELRLKSNAHSNDIGEMNNSHLYLLLSIKAERRLA